MRRVYFYHIIPYFIGILLSSVYLHAQTAPPAIQWEKSLGGTGNDFTRSIQQTRDGGYIIAGRTESTDGDVTGNHGNEDAWVVKLDAMGNIQWKKCYGGSNYDAALCVQQTRDGGYIIAGGSKSTDGDVTGNHGRTDYWIVKLDSAGAIKWQKSLGGSSDDIANSIRQTTDGGYIVAGSSNSQDGDVTGNHGSENYWVVKLDSTGNIRWEKSYGGSSGEAATCIRQTRDGGYVVAGWSFSQDGDVTGHHGDNFHQDYWVVKLDTSGNIQWEKSLGGTGDDAAQSIEQTSDDGYIVAGESQSGDGDVTGNFNAIGGNYWIVKLDSAGNIQWEKCYGNIGDEGAFDIQQIKESYIVAGSADSPGGEVTNGYGGEDYWIVKIDLSDSILWERAYGGNATDIATSIQPTADNGYIVTGISESNNYDVTGHHGGDTTQDWWIVKLAFPATITSVQQQTFAPLLCGTQEYDTLWVHNTGTMPLAISSAPFSANGGYYKLIAPALPDSIKGGDSALFIIQFAPTAAGTFPTTLKLNNNDTATGHNPWQISFTGKKDSINLFWVGIANDTLDLDTVLTGVAKDSSFAIFNASSLPTTFLLQTGDTSVFRIVSLAYIQSDSLDTIGIHFAGEKTAGRYLDSVIVTDTCGRTYTTYLRVIVINKLYTSIEITNPINAGAIHINTRDTVPFTIRNTGTANLIIDSITLKGYYAPSYQLLNVPQLPVTLSPGSAQTMEIIFSPVNAGVQDATLEIVTNASPTPADIAVNGIGERSILAATAVDFDTVQVDSCVTKTMTITNAGDYSLVVTRMNLLGAYAGNYTILTIPTDTLHPGDTATVAVRFCPTGSGEEDVIAECITNDGDTLYVNIYGAGRGTSSVPIILPSATSLSQNYPNPFTNMTTIRVTLSQGDAQNAQLKVYNMLGEEVADLTDQLSADGNVTFNAGVNKAGVYYYVLQTASGRITRQMFVVK